MVYKLTAEARPKLNLLDEYLFAIQNHSVSAQGAALIPICIEILFPVSFRPHHTKSNFLPFS